MSFHFFELSMDGASEGGAFTRFISTPRYQFLVILVLASFLCTIKLGRGGLAAHDECYYAQKAKEMLDSGDWLTPTFGGRVRFDNPPVHIWVVAASFKIFGTSDWSARIPTAVQAVLVILLTYLLAQWLFGLPWISLLSASGLLLCDYFYKFSRKAHMDHLMTLLFMSALLSFIAGRRRNQAWFLLTGLSIGLAVLTKSALGLFPLIVVALYIVIEREWGLLRRPLFWGGLAVCALVVLGWYAYEYDLYGQRFIRAHVNWLLYQRSILGSRYGASGTVHAFLAKMGSNLYFFIRDAHIWFVMGVLGMAGWLIRKGGGRPDRGESRREAMILPLWLAVPVIIMTFSGEFKTWYLMPVFVPLSIFSAIFLSRVLGGGRGIRIASITALAMLALHLAVLTMTPLFTLDVGHGVRHPGIRKLATKVRALEQGKRGRTILFPATDDIAAVNGLGVCPFSYWSIVQPWTFYSDQTLFPPEYEPSIDQVRAYMDDEEGVCLTTGRGYEVLSGGGELPYRVIGRVRDGSMEYVACCGARSYEKWREIIEGDFSAPPSYGRRYR